MLNERIPLVKIVTLGPLKGSLLTSVILMAAGFLPVNCALTGRHLSAQEVQRQDKQPDALEFVQPDADLVAVIRPALLLNRNLPAPMRGVLKQMLRSAIGNVAEAMEVELDRIDRLIMCQSVPTPDRRPSNYLVVKTLGPTERPAWDGWNPSQLLQKIVGGGRGGRASPAPTVKEHLETSAASTLELDGHQVFQLPRGPYRFAYVADAQTVLWAQAQEQLQTALGASPDAAKRATWYPAWEEFSAKPLVLIFNGSMLQQASEQWFQDRSELPFETSKEILEPEFVVAALQLNESIKANATAQYPQAQIAKDAKTKALDWTSFAKFLLDDLPTDDSSEFLIRSAKDGLQNLKLSQAGKTVLAETTVKIDQSMLAEYLQSTVIAGQIRTEAMNHSRQLALACHNYYDAHKTLPPALVLGENNTVHSWRIALLPFIGEGEMYRQYHFDEPWDSPHNSQLTARMPDFFRHPAAPADSTSPGFMVVEGEGMLFSGMVGATFQDVRDGTSKTIMMIEAKRDIHWANPQNITLEEALRPGGVGGYSTGGFIATFADGSAHFIDENVNLQTLSNLLTINDGEIVELHR